MLCWLVEQWVVTSISQVPNAFVKEPSDIWHLRMKAKRSFEGVGTFIQQQATHHRRPDPHQANHRMKKILKWVPEKLVTVIWVGQTDRHRFDCGLVVWGTFWDQIRMAELHYTMHRIPDGWLALQSTKFACSLFIHLLLWKLGSVEVCQSDCTNTCLVVEL